MSDLGHRAVGRAADPAADAPPSRRLLDGFLVALVLIALVSVIGVVAAVLPDGAGGEGRRSELVRAVGRYRAALDAHDVSILEPLLGSDFTFHNSEFGSVQDRRGFLAWARTIGGAYPDFAVGIDSVRFAADVAWIEFHEMTSEARGRARGPRTGMVIVRVADGRITDLWSNYEEFGLLHDRARRSAETG